MLEPIQIHSRLLQKNILFFVQERTEIQQEEEAKMKTRSQNQNLQYINHSTIFQKSTTTRSIFTNSKIFQSIKALNAIDGEICLLDKLSEKKPNTVSPHFLDAVEMYTHFAEYNYFNFQIRSILRMIILQKKSISTIFVDNYMMYFCLTYFYENTI